MASDSNSVGWLTWASPTFSSSSQISYHIYVENQHGQSLYDIITEDTSFKLQNLRICDIYTATIIAQSEKYNSSNVTIKDQYNEGVLLNIYMCLNLSILFL